LVLVKLVFTQTLNFRMGDWSTNQSLTQVILARYQYMIPPCSGGKVGT